MTSEGDGLERDLCAALEWGCEQVRQMSAEPGGLPQREVQRLNRAEGHLEAVAGSVVNWMQLRNELTETAGFEERIAPLVKRLEDGDGIRYGFDARLDQDLRLKMTADVTLFPALKLYHALQTGWEWDEDAALQAIAEWADDQKALSLGYNRTIAPLRRFEGPDEAIVLDEDVVIRPFTDPERESLWNEDHTNLLSLMALNEWSHAIDCRWRVKGSNSFFDHDEGLNRVQDVVRALHIHHPGLGERTIVWTRSDPPGELDGLRSRALMHTPIDADYSHGIPEDYLHGPEARPLTQVSVGDSEALGRLFRGIRAAREDGRLSLALRRFDSAYERHNAEDSLIDLWIAFEALLLPDGQSELSYRAAMRIALLAANEGAARREAFQQARTSYKCRSQVVHGAPTTDDLDEVVRQTRELARKVLRAWILDPPSAIEEIDRSLFD